MSCGEGCTGGGRTQVRTTSASKRGTGGGKRRVSTRRGGERCTGGGRMQVSTTSGSKRGIGGGRTRVSTAGGGKRGTSSSRTQVKTTCGSKIPLRWHASTKWPVYISSALQLMECTLYSRLWVHSSFKFNTWEQEEMLC